MFETSKTGSEVNLGDGSTRARDQAPSQVFGIDVKAKKSLKRFI